MTPPTAPPTGLPAAPPTAPPPGLPSEGPTGPLAGVALPRTGSSAGVDVLVAHRVAGLPADLNGHVTAYEDIARLLQDALATLDEA